MKGLATTVMKISLMKHNKICLKIKKYYSEFNNHYDQINIIIVLLAQQLKPNYENNSEKLLLAQSGKRIKYKIKIISSSERKDKAMLKPDF